GGDGHDGVVAGVDGGAAGQEGVRLDRAAVVGQGTEFRVDGVGGCAHLVVVGAAVSQAAAGPVADQVVAAGRADGEAEIAADRAAVPEVAGDDGVVHDDQIAGGQAAAGGAGGAVGGIAGDGGMGDGDSAGGLEAAAVGAGMVAREGAVGN